MTLNRQLQHRFYSGDECQQLCKDSVIQDPCFFLGTVPEPIFKALEAQGLTAEHWLNAFKKLAQYLVDNPLTVFRASKIKVEWIPSFELKCVGKGTSGMVFRLAWGNTHYALKIYRKDRLDWFQHGPYAEIAAGLFFNTLNEPVFSKFYCGHPEDGWMLDEWVHGDTRRNATGLKVGKVLKKYGLIHFDDKPNNYIRNILVDRGGIIHKPTNAILFDMKAYFRRLENPETARTTAEQVYLLFFTGSQKQAFEVILKDYPHLHIHAIRTIGMFNKSFRKAAIGLALEYSKGNADYLAAEQIWYLHPKQQYSMFTTVMKNYPELRQRTIRQLFRLHPAVAAQSVQWILEHYPEQMKILIDQFFFLNKDSKPQILKEIPNLEAFGFEINGSHNGSLQTEMRIVLNDI